MKTKLAVVLGLVIAVSSGVWLVAAPTPAPDGHEKPAEEASQADMKAMLAKVREQIAGKEDKPAEEVFQNIEILAGFPAGRVPAIMEYGFSRSLGVDCTHCHEDGNFASNEKRAKGIAREMWTFSAEVNKQLREVPGLQQPVVNCTTCHRGQVKPATNLD